MIDKRIEEEEQRLLERMKTLKPVDAEHKAAVEALAVLQRARLEEEKAEFEDRKNGDELALKQLEIEQAEKNAVLEKKKFKARVVLDALGIAIPAALYATFAVLGFRFEKTGSFFSQTTKMNFQNIFRFRK